MLLLGSSLLFAGVIKSAEDEVMFYVPLKNTIPTKTRSHDPKQIRYPDEWKDYQRRTFEGSFSGSIPFRVNSVAYQGQPGAKKLEL